MFKSAESRIRWNAGLALAAAVLLIAHQLYLSRTLAAHVSAGGVDDPDAVFGRWHLLVTVFLVAMLFRGVLGFIVCGIAWLRQSKGRR